MNLKKKFVIGAASVALVAGMGGVAAPAAVADTSLPGSIMKLERLGGLDRVQTSLKVAKAEFGTKAPERLYIVSAADGNMVDAATAGMLTDGPIVFVYNNSYVATAVGKDVAANIAGIKEVVAIGGDGVISDSTLNAVKDAMKVKKTSRLAGKDRYETSVAIADYIYTQSIKGDKSFADRTSGSGNFLMNAYLANGANEHVVDSMVAGTLDDGAILLVQPDGKIPEVVAEFIKKALPTQFSALGGTGAVSDATVNEAWVIKALGNKWETSYSIPNLREKIDELNFLIDGVKDQTGTNLSDKATFGGLKHVVEAASANYDSWANAVSNEKQQISNWFVNNTGKTPAEAYAGIQTNLENLYGTGVVTDDPKFYNLDANKKAKSVNYEAIEATQTYKDAVKKATDELDKVWADEKHQGTIADAIAVASQKHKTAASGVTNQFAQIAEVAKYTLDNDKKWLDTVEKQRASLKAEWRTEFDKIAPKTVQRFGGADRFETAQLIANWFSKYHVVEAAYVANGTRLADSLAAGQLTGGPILLVRNDTKIPEFTTNVATHLLCWNGKPIKVSAIGGEGVVSDDVLSTMVDLIGTKSVCKVKTPDAKTIVGGTWTAQAEVADSAAFSTANIQFAAPTDPTSGVTYALVSNTPSYTGSATAANVTAAIDSNAGTITLTGGNGAGAANAGTYTWKVKMSAPGYADKTVDVTVKAN
ncbi:cell wall-binding repeat-containing protein [Mobiluncus sp.]|uniref:cell wall-binding repeat-containing protein n=1 Tax=Mobiluncus sp. TaxID=47293 RepID=UPI002A91ECF6|nr:cell wall-binding repeat-containing protein [Mobiluncus sp.]MDY6076168.1 cell wall-binding repeat-containing protein [Mobiluncus sp.]